MISDSDEHRRLKRSGSSRRSNRPAPRRSAYYSGRSNRPTPRRYVARPPVRRVTPAAVYRPVTYNYRPRTTSVRKTTVRRTYTKPVSYATRSYKKVYRKVTKRTIVRSPRYSSAYGVRYNSYNTYLVNGRTTRPLLTYYRPIGYYNARGYYSLVYGKIYYNGYGYNFYTRRYGYYQTSANAIIVGGAVGTGVIVAVVIVVMLLCCVLPIILCCCCSCCKGKAMNEKMEMMEHRDDEVEVIEEIVEEEIIEEHHPNIHVHQGAQPPSSGFTMGHQPAYPPAYPQGQPGYPQA
jgi:hypothetical protein